MAPLNDRLLGERSAPTRQPGSLGGTIVLLAGPPISVVATLMVLGSVPAAFLVYHVGWCLLVPALVSLIRGEGGAGHRERLGLAGGVDRQALGPGALVGLLMFLGILLPFVLLADVLLGGADLARQLAVWGVPAGADASLVVYMIVFNSGAEELYWRGFVHDRMEAWRDRWSALLLTTGFFASYHYYTIVSLVQDVPVAALMTVGVFAGGLVWAILRERYGSVYPAIVAHVGATLGYMSVYVLWV